MLRYVEKAKSDRSRCRICGRAIRKRTVRLVEEEYKLFSYQKKHHCKRCAISICKNGIREIRRLLKQLEKGGERSGSKNKGS